MIAFVLCMLLAGISGWLCEFSATRRLRAENAKLRADLDALTGLHASAEAQAAKVKRLREQVPAKGVHNVQTSVEMLVVALYSDEGGLLGVLHEDESLAVGVHIDHEKLLPQEQRRLENLPGYLAEKYRRV